MGERDQDDVGADDASHHRGVGNAERANLGLLLQVREAFFEVGVNGEGEAGFGDFGIFAALERQDGGFGSVGIFARIRQVLARRDVAAAHLVEAKGRDEIRGAVDREDAGDADPVVQEADERAGDQHAALHPDQNGGVRASELAGRNHLLHERVHGGPIHGGAHAGDERHRVEMPELEVAPPRDVGCSEHHEAAAEIEQDAEIPAVQPVDEHAAEKRYEQARQRDNDHLQADLDGRVRGRKDVPTHGGEVQAAAEERNEHRHGEETEAALRPNQVPVDTSCGYGGHGTHKFTIVGDVGGRRDRHVLRVEARNHGE